jgi:hypothetical protein
MLDITKGFPSKNPKFGNFRQPLDIKLNATLDELVVTNTKTLLREYKAIFA